jgi:hypothetical protein
MQGINSQTEVLSIPSQKVQVLITKELTLMSQGLIRFYSISTKAFDSH